MFEQFFRPARQVQVLASENIQQQARPWIAEIYEARNDSSNLFVTFPIGGREILEKFGAECIDQAQLGRAELRFPVRRFHRACPFRASVQDLGKAASGWTARDHAVASSGLQLRGYHKERAAKNCAQNCAHPIRKTREFAGYSGNKGIAVGY